MGNIVLWGDSGDLPQIASLLWQAGHTITLAGDPSVPLPHADLHLALVEQGTTFDTYRLDDVPLLVWNRTNDPSMTLAAYAAGVSAVLPAQTPLPLLVQSVRQILATRHKPAASTTIPLQRLYKQGDSIHISGDTILLMDTGIVAQTVIHQDGSQVLLGLYGSGQILLPHPEDGCFIYLVAHTDVSVQVLPWAQALRLPDFAGRLRLRLRLMEAWSANQARPYLADRVLGLLTLLGEQFGVVTAHGLRVDVRITHAQIATAVGAARTTVTRILGELRRRRLVMSVGTGEAERFYLPSWQDGHHLTRDLAISWGLETEK